MIETLPQRSPRYYAVIRERFDMQGPRVAFGMWATRRKAQKAIRDHAKSHPRQTVYNYTVVPFYWTVK